MRAGLILLVACHAKQPDRAPCSTVAARFDHVARAGLGSDVDDAVRRGAETQLDGIRSALEKLCVDGKWSAEARDCMVAADDRVTLDACAQKLTDEQRRALDK